MSRMTRAILAILFIAVIGVSAISICHGLFKNMRLDMTEHRLYTLSDGTKEILGGLKQPITMKLFYLPEVEFPGHQRRLKIALLNSGHWKGGKTTVSLLKKAVPAGGIIATMLKAQLFFFVTTTSTSMGTPSTVPTTLSRRAPRPSNINSRVSVTVRPSMAPAICEASTLRGLSPVELSQNTSVDMVER